VATIISAITNGGVVYLVTSGSPSSGGGTDANIGSIATNENTGDLYTKIGSGLSDWILLTGFVPYIGATANVDLGAFSLTTPTIYGGATASATLTLSSTSNPTKGKILFGTSVYDEVNNRLGIGTISPAFDFDLIKSVPASYVGANVQNTNATGYSFIEVLGDNNTTYSSLNVFNTAGGVGTFYDNNTAGVATNSPTLSFLINENATGGWVLTAGGYGTGSEKARFTINATSFRQAAATSGAITQFTFTTSNNTNQTLSTNISNFRVTGSTKQWATGALATQYFNYFTANTVSFVGASTATNVYNLFCESPIAGVNSTITNNYAAGFGGRVNILSDTATIMIGSQVGSTARGAIYINQATPDTTNFALSAHQTSGGTFINGALGVSILYSGSIQVAYADKLVTFGGGLTHFDFNFGGTNGTKLGTATTQKLSFWNATPIVQPTTAVAASALISNLGTPLTSTDTFDGYTLQQIVKALRNTGLLQ